MVTQRALAFREEGQLYVEFTKLYYLFDLLFNTSD